MAYIVNEWEGKNKNSKKKEKEFFVFPKSRLAPIKEIIIPRRELLMVLIGVKIASYVAKELNLEQIEQFIRTDSQSIFENRSFQKKFVENHSQEHEDQNRWYSMC